MGSPSGIWTSVSGAMAQSQNLEVIANNLANVNTTGYKKDTTTFKEYLTAVERPPSPDIDIPRTIFKDSDFYHFDGREHAMVNVNGVGTDHSQGSFKMTNAPLDLAIDGPAYFTVQGPNGNLYTRNGSFKVSTSGQLVTQDGYPVLALSPQVLQQLQNASQQPNATGTDVNGRNPASLNPFTQPVDPQGQPLLVAVNLARPQSGVQSVTATSDGQIYSGDILLGRLALAQFVDPKRMVKVGSTYFSNPDGVNVPSLGRSSIRQGFLEASNVNPVTELVEMLKANRMFESNMKAIKSYNDMAVKEANEVGKL